MPARRTHSKSRNGCLQCKSRHVKCDEVSPVCGNCAKREASCSYVTLNDSPADPGTPDSSKHVPNTAYPILSRAQELSLIHHFSTRTWKTLCFDAQDYHTWQVSIPELAFQHPFLLDTLLAITALHRGLDISRVVEYQNRGLARFKDVLCKGITPEISNAAFAYATLTTLISFAMPHPGPEDTVEQVLQFSAHFRGCALVLSSAPTALQDGVLSSFIQLSPLTSRHVHPKIQSKVNARLNSLYAISVDEPEVTVYHTAIRQMITTFHENFKGLISYTLHLEPRFSQLLQQRTPMSLLIFMSYGVLLELMDAWWARGVGKRLVQYITTPADRFSSDPDRLALVEWARQLVGLDASLVDDAHLTTDEEIDSAVDIHSSTAMEDVSNTDTRMNTPENDSVMEPEFFYSRLDDALRVLNQPVTTGYSPKEKIEY